MSSAYHRLPVLAAVVLLAGCYDLVGLWDHRPPSYAERDGLSYQVIVTESRYAYDAFEYRIRITNTSHGTIDRRLPEDLARPRVYRDGRWSRPVWDPCEWNCGSWGRDFPLRLRRGEAVEGWGGRVDARDFASRSRGGTYHLAVVIDTGRDRFEVLGLPELYVR
ncbi:MAG: hypothetical protein R6U63_16370 [Longimicrobiales bacterium]